MVDDDDGEDLDIRAHIRGSSTVAVVNKTSSLSPVRESSVSSETVLSSSSSSSSSVSSSTSSSTLDSISSLKLYRVQPESEHYCTLTQYTARTDRDMLDNIDNYNGRRQSIFIPFVYYAFVLHTKTLIGCLRHT